MILFRINKEEQLSQELIKAYNYRLKAGVFEDYRLAKESFGILSYARVGDRLSFKSSMLSLFVLCCLHAIIHESGHLVFGLLSGYKFSSFRVGKVILAKKRMD